MRNMNKYDPVSRLLLYLCKTLYQMILLNYERAGDKKYVRNVLQCSGIFQSRLIKHSSCKI